MTPHVAWIAVVMVATFGGGGSMSARPLPTVAKVDLARLARLLGDWYTTTVIARNKRDHAWIMSRTPTMPEPEYTRVS